MQDVCQLVERKASSEEVDALVRRLSMEIRERAHSGELRKAVERQELVNKGLSSNMSVGRWMWTSGKHRSGKRIPWNCQTMNRCAHTPSASRVVRVEMCDCVHVDHFLLKLLQCCTCEWIRGEDLTEHHAAILKTSYGKGTNRPSLLSSLAFTS